MQILIQPICCRIFCTNRFINTLMKHFKQCNRTDVFNMIKKRTRTKMGCTSNNTKLTQAKRRMCVSHK